MNKIKDIEHRAKSDLSTERWRDSARERRSEGTKQFMHLNDHHSDAGTYAAGWIMTNDQWPMTSDFLQIKKPQQFNLPGSKYKSISCLPQEGFFNSGVCTAAAAITMICSTNSSLRATLPGETNHPKFITRFVTGCIHNKLPEQKVWEGLPMN